MLKVSSLIRRLSNGRSSLCNGAFRPATAVASLSSLVAQQKFNGREALVNERVYTKNKILEECKASAKDKFEHHCTTIMKLMKLCATSEVYESPETKAKLAEHLFKTLGKTGRKRDVGTYNLLLRIYNYNEHKFVPSEFLNLMKEDECHPNLITFNHLVAAFCIQGNISGTSRLLEFMKNSGLPMTKFIYASLVTGHSRAGDLAAAEEILSSMKARNLNPDSTVYLHLLCAYAERGLIEKIKKTCHQMNIETVYPSLLTYLVVMDTLSKHGHGKLVPEVLSLIENDSWIAPDLRQLAHSCLARGELEAPLCIMTYLSQRGAMSNELAGRYFPVAFAKGLSVSTSLEKLKEHVDIRSLKWVIQDMVASFVFAKFPSSYGKSDLPPSKGALPPLSGDVSWLLDMKLCLRMLSEVREMSEHHFYPLFARHCSDGDIAEMIKTFYLMMELECELHGRAYAKIYMIGTICNTEFCSIAHYFSSLNLEKEYDEQWLVEHIVFLCAFKRWEDASTLLEKLDQGVLEKHKKALLMALSPTEDSEKTKLSCMNFVMAVCKHLKSTEDIPYQMFWIGRRLNVATLSHFLNQGIEVPLDPIVSRYKELCDEHMIDYPTEIWKLLDMAKYYTPKGLHLEYLYQSTVRLFSSSKVHSAKCAELYEMMTDRQKELFDVRCYHVVHLISTQKFQAAIEEFMPLMAAGRNVPTLTWKRIVCEAYLHDPCLADDLLEKMKRHTSPNLYMLYDLIDIHCHRKDLARAENTLKIYKKTLKESGQNSIGLMKVYEPMLELWSDCGEVDKVDEVGKLNVINKRSIKEARVIALINSKQPGQAMDELLKIRKPNLSFVQTLLRLLVFNNYPLDEWKDILIKRQVPKKILESKLFFIFIDFDVIDEAKHVLQNLGTIQQKEFVYCMSSPQAEKYQKVLNEVGENVHVGSTKEPPRVDESVDEESIVYSDVVIDVDDLHGKLSDFEAKL